ncbi:carbohydrate ABC transporter permease [Clostridium lacusfryxellense]|uniref:carbohydrate ABC transporter permease n=1 Tax=Clostridium lacusfryxellense TaxID=205328 RepID=UPI001C0C25B0|nr:carbohydrate ABC transporter permease [Clostridium lacusfryxellense]MBU3113334.1 carbohydrate ABC transporter permease [Clostridium lacusfryxellense]
MIDNSLSRKIFQTFNYTFIIFLAFICLFPLLNVLAVSFSSANAVSAGEVKLWPKEFTLDSYKYIISNSAFGLAFMVSVKRLIIGASLQMLITILVAYPMSLNDNEFKGKAFYRWMLIVTMLFSGGLIPTYMLISKLHMVDTIWALVIPNAVPVFNIILLMNFFKGLPKEISEAAFIDGADHLKVLWDIILPLSKPCLATILLFCMVGHWNSWFDGLIYMNTADHYPLQSYLQTKIMTVDLSLITSEQVASLKAVSNRTQKAAQIFVAVFPILCVYPFLQKHFTKGLVMGSVKG